MKDFSQPRTKAMAAFIAKEGPEGTGRVVGLSIECDGVFIYTNSAEWCDDSGAGTFRGDSETDAIRKFRERVQKADPAYVAAEREWQESPRNPLNARPCEKCGAPVLLRGPCVTEARDNGPARHWHTDCAPLALGGPDKRAADTERRARENGRAVLLSTYRNARTAARVFRNDPATRAALVRTAWQVRGELRADARAAKPEPARGGFRIDPKTVTLDAMDRDAIARGLELLAVATDRSIDLKRAAIARKGYAPRWSAELETLEARAARVEDLRAMLSPE